MHKQVKSLDIILENCECFNILPESIRYMYFNINKKSGRIDNICKRSLADYSESESADLVKLILVDVYKVISNENFGSKFIDRVRTGGDITQIHINYNDGTTYWFYVPWDDCDRQYNPFQIVKYKKNEMYILICKDKPEDIDDEE